MSNQMRELDKLLKTSNLRDIADACQYEDTADIIATLRALKKRRQRLSAGKKPLVPRAKKVVIQQGIAETVQKFQVEKKSNRQNGA